MSPLYQSDRDASQHNIAFDANNKTAAKCKLASSVCLLQVLNKLMKNRISSVPTLKSLTDVSIKLVVAVHYL